MKTDYMTSAAALPPHLAYPSVLLTANIKPITKVVYAVLLDAAMSAQHLDKQGRRYAAITVDDISAIIDRTPATVRNALNDLEGAGMVERMPTGYKAPARIYVKLPSGGGME